jgi:transposase InsO family protein
VVVAGATPDLTEHHHCARERRRRRHERFLDEVARAGRAPARRRHRFRTVGWQIDRRERERRLRLRCLALARWARWNGWSPERFAAVFGLDLHTLRGWQAQVGKAAQPLGAKPISATPQQRRAVADFVSLWNACLSFRDLQEHFPDLPRNALGNLFWAFVTARQRDPTICLRWTTPGAVWAMDFSHADHPIEGAFPYLFVVRDLASGFQIAALPCHKADGETAVKLLRSLFKRFPPPLVIKSDNGSHFVNFDMLVLLQSLDITLLLSPPYYPPYNGACEAGIGAIKTRIHHRAARDGDPTRWTLEQVEAARCEGNYHDWAGGDTTPNDKWMSAAPTSDLERKRFKASVDSAIFRRRDQAARLKLDRPTPLHTLIRRGIADALVGGGYVQYRSRLVHQPLLAEERA